MASEGAGQEAGSPFYGDGLGGEGEIAGVVGVGVERDSVVCGGQSSEVVILHGDIGGAV